MSTVNAREYALSQVKAITESLIAKTKEKAAKGEMFLADAAEVVGLQEWENYAEQAGPDAEATIEAIERTVNDRIDLFDYGDLL